MLWLLVKKQFSEIFRNYFYDPKKNKMRSGFAAVCWGILFFLLIGFLAGAFAMLSFSLCGGLTAAGTGWIYFLVMGGMAILLGAFGSVFNTYSSLYLSRDNDLLLSLPIPVETIIASRLLSVYLLGAIYSSLVLIPALIVYWTTVGATASRLICGNLFLLIITIIILLLSCILGRGVAEISMRVKNKNYITVISSVLFLGIYYFFYFKANNFIRELVLNAETYGNEIKGTAYGLYLFGRIGEGDWLAAALYSVIAAVLLWLVLKMLNRSFLNIATAGDKTAKVRYTEKKVKQKTAFQALLQKELARFTSSANYMLNCGLGILLIPVGGIALLLKGKMLCELFGEVFTGYPDIAAILFAAMLCTLSSMNDMTAPSVSLEGKSLWIPQSLPVEGKQVLRSKLCVQLLLTGIPILFAGGCAAFAAETSAAAKVLLILLALAYTAFSALFGMMIGLKMPLLNWTNEVVPIKQSGAVMIVLFGGWVVSILFVVLYFMIGSQIGAVMYMLIWTILLSLGSLILMRWLDTKGASLFSTL